MTTKENETIFLPLEDMNSEHCALIIDKGLSQIEGIESHKVELNNHRAALEAQNTQAVKEAIKAINNLGYGVTTVKQTFPVLDMSCASCAISAESTAKTTKGVIDASVNFATATLSVEYLPNMTSPAELQKAVQAVGFDLLLEEESTQQETLEAIHDKKFKVLKKKTIWAIILSLPVVVIGMFLPDIPYANVIMWAFSTPVLAWLGKDFFVNAWKQAKHRSANMDTLVALSTGIAYTFSVFNMLFPEVWRARGLEAHLNCEAAAGITASI